MRRWAALALALATCQMAGCISEEPLRTSAWAERFRKFGYSEQAPVVQFEVRLIEQPVGDRYINRDLWREHTDDWVVGDAKSVLEKNGFRVGRLVGQPPSELQRLMVSERSCINPRVLVKAAGKETQLHLGPVMTTCKCRVYHDDNVTEVELHQAQCSLMVVPTFTEDGKTRLKFTPKVRHGDHISQFRPASDRSGWLLEVGPQARLFPELSWEVTLAPNEYLLVGCMPERPDTLGFRSFVDCGSLAPVQRLLVLRTARSGDAGIDAEIAPGPVDQSAANTISLAVQSSRTTVRANRR